MVKYLVKCFGIATLLMLLGLAVAGGSASAAAPTTPCATVSVAVTPAVAHPNDPMNFSGSLTNCSGAAETITLTYAVSSPCYPDSGRSFPVTLRANETYSLNTPFRAPGCLGNYSLTVTASSGNVLLSTSTGSFTVTAANFGVSGSK